MAKHNINIQDGFLFQNLKEAQTLRVELTDGRALVGILKRFDRFALVLADEEETETLIYKHAIATVGPHSPEG